MMTVEKFVDTDSIDPVYYDAAYFLAPDGDAGRDVYAVLREAVAHYRADRQQEGVEQYFGLWARHGADEDGVAFQQRMRAEWDRDEDASAA